VVEEGSACHAFLRKEDYPNIFDSQSLHCELWREAVGGPLRGARSESVREAVSHTGVPKLYNAGIKYARANTDRVFVLKVFWETPGPDFSTAIEHYLDVTNPMRRITNNKRNRRSSAVFTSLDCPELFYGGCVTGLAMYHQSVDQKSFGDCRVIELFPPRWTSCPGKKRRRTEHRRRRVSHRWRKR
jgi:hypothetical protein